MVQALYLYVIWEIRWGHQNHGAESLVFKHLVLGMLGGSREMGQCVYCRLRKRTQLFKGMCLAVADMEESYLVLNHTWFRIKNHNYMWATTSSIITGVANTAKFKVFENCGSGSLKSEFKSGKLDSIYVPSEFQGLYHLSLTTHWYWCRKIKFKEKAGGEEKNKNCCTFHRITFLKITWVGYGDPKQKLSPCNPIVLPPLDPAEC